MRGRKAPTPARDRRVVGYVRVSTEEQAREGVSLAAQEARIRSYVESRGWPLHEIVVDDGQSAKTLKRDGLQRILSEVRAGEVATLIVVKLDRLTRSIKDLVQVLELFQKADTAIVSVSESIDASTAVGRMMVHLLGILAQLERELIAERTSDALAHKRRTGAAYSPTPFGYRREGDRFVVDRPQQAVLSKMRRMAAAGASLRQIGAALTKSKVSPPRGGRVWHAQSIRSILHSKIAAEAA